MYNASSFKVTDTATLRDAIRTIGAAELITYGTEGIEASIAALLISDDGMTLSGHLSKANPQWKNADLSQPVLVTWLGPNAYISPSYYPSKAEHGKVVPTWNYITIHARGYLVIHDDPVWLRQLVESLTDFHESDLVDPWRVSDAPSSYLDSMVKGIVGIEVRVTSLEGKWKLSQNRTAPDVAGVIAGLATHGPGSDESRIAEAMRHLER